MLKKFIRPGVDCCLLELVEIASMTICIEVDRLSKTYLHEKKEIQALEEISLIIERGDVYGIIGQSGAGKSTLIRALAGLVPPTSGSILFQGIDIAHMDRVSQLRFRKKIGMIFQHFNLLSSRTVWGNIAYPLEIAGVGKEEKSKRIEELLELVSLRDKRDAYPSQLSGGEKQRVGIARALANHPEVLFCDEATSALDPKTTKEVLSLLKSINQKLELTIVLITHEMEVVKQICNKVAVLDKGRIVEKGLVATIFTEPEHPITQHFLQSASHDIPAEFYKEISPKRKLLRLRFKGEVAGEPIISELIKTFHVDANILLGWIDRLQTLTCGTLIIELSGSAQGVQDSLDYLTKKSVHYEVMTPHGS
jgi:D-methionine transport system ATP-binding protein